MPQTTEITATGRYIILIAAFLGWMFSGFQMAVMTLSARSATTEFLRSGQLSTGQMLRVERLFVGARLVSQPPPPVSGEAEMSPCYVAACAAVAVESDDVDA